jgi:hypothetical protein
VDSAWRDAVVRGEWPVDMGREVVGEVVGEEGKGVEAAACTIGDPKKVVGSGGSTRERRGRESARWVRSSSSLSAPMPPADEEEEGRG